MTSTPSPSAPPDRSRRCLADHSLLPITGHTDRLSYLPGETVSVHASSTHRNGSLRLVRLSHDGQRFTKAPITEPTAIPLAHQEVRLESHGLVDTMHLPQRVSPQPESAF